VATHVLKKNWDRFEVEDILKESFDIENCSGDALIELNVYASGIKDYSFFDYDNLYHIFASKSDAVMKKSAIEQLSILINDKSDKNSISGRNLFREKKKGRDVFSLVINQLLEFHSQSGAKGINSLHPNEINYIQELLRFLSLSFLFYFDESVVLEFLKPYLEIEDIED